MKAPVPLLLLLLIQCASGRPLDWPSTTFAPDSSYAGDPTGIEIIGDRLFLSTTYNIAAYDVSDPAAISFLGTSLTSGSTQRMVVSGDDAYLVGYHADLSILDLSAPDADLPRIGGYEIDGSASMVGVGISGDRVFVSGHGTGLIVLDVSSPENPQVIGEADHDVGSTGYFAGEHIRVVGDLIYIAGHDDDYGAFALYRDVPDGDPQFLSDFTVWDLPGNSTPTGHMPRVEPNGDLAYILDGGAGLLVLDLANPTDPKLITPPDQPGGTKLSTFRADDFVLSGNLIAAASSGKFSVIDVSTATAPVIRGQLDLRTGGGQIKICAAGTTAYASSRDTIYVIDFSDMNNPALLGSLPITGRQVTDVQLVGDLAYLTDRGIGVFDVSDPANPIEVGRNESGRYRSLRIDGHRIAARNSSQSSIGLYQLANEGRSPTPLGTLSLRTLRNYDVEGNRVWATHPNEGLFTYSFGPNPTQLSQWLDPDLKIDFFDVEGTTLYAGSWQHGFVIMDVTDPAAPTLIGSLGGNQVSHFTIDGTLVYGARSSTVGEETEIVIIDIADPFAPSELGALVIPGYNGYISDLTVCNGLLFGSRYYSEPMAFVVDVADPSDPRLVRNHLGCGRIDHLAASGDSLFLAHGYLGLHVLDISVQTPQLRIDRALSLNWDAPSGVPFPVEGSLDLRTWLPLGRFNGDELDAATEQLPGARAYFRATDR